MFDKSKIYSNVGYSISAYSAKILNIYAPLWAIEIAIWFQYDERIWKAPLRRKKFDFKKIRKRKQKREKQTKKAYEKGGLEFSSI